MTVALPRAMSASAQPGTVAFTEKTPMTTRSQYPVPAGRRALLAAFGLAALLGVVVMADAQDAKDGKDGKDGKPKAIKDPNLRLVLDPGEVQAALKQRDVGGPRSRNLVRVGYTRPGSPSDRVGADGDVLPVKFGEIKGKVLGGTVYFAVYERPGFDNLGRGEKAE